MGRRRGVRACALLVVTAGCDSPSEATSPHDASTPFEPPGQVTIRVRNDGARTLYVQASGWSGQEVISIHTADGATIGADTCEVCNCAGCPSCSVCGRSLAYVAELVPGGTFDVLWDQTDWHVTGGCGPGSSCEQPRLVPPGSLTIRVEFAETFTGSMSAGEETYLSMPVLIAETSFAHPSSSDIVIAPIE